MASAPHTSSLAPVLDLIEAHRSSIQTPYYLIDEARLLKNLDTVALVHERSGAKAVLALKCFATPSVFDLMRPYLHGTTSSSVYEARLGHERFGKEVHAYSVAFSDEDIAAVRPYATKIIFNSVSQLKRLHPLVPGIPLGLRLNPGVSHSAFELADPSRKFSRLGATDPDEIAKVAWLIGGVMFHCNCENESFDKFSALLDHIGREYGTLLEHMQWVSLGGGIAFTRDDYPLDAFCEKLADFAARFDVQVYLEPGDALVTHSAYLVTKVLDIVHNEVDVAIVDAGMETHMLDYLIYRMDARFGSAPAETPAGSGHRYTVAGRTCLAGDVFGTHVFPEQLTIGSLIPIADAAGYTMVKKNWFNGLPMPSTVVRRLDGRVEVVKQFGYEDFVAGLS